MNPYADYFGIPIIEDSAVPEGAWFLLPNPLRLLIQPAVPVVPYGEVLCSISRRHAELTGLCRICRAVV